MKRTKIFLMAMIVLMLLTACGEKAESTIDAVEEKINETTVVNVQETETETFETVTEESIEDTVSENTTITESEVTEAEEPELYNSYMNLSLKNVKK